MEEHREGVAFPPTVMGTAEGQMVRADLVRQIVARRERGESTRQIARELAVDRKTGGAGCRSAAGNRGKAASGRAQSIHASNSSSGAGQKWPGTAWSCIGNWWRWDSAAVISRCSDC
jgi:hypothetical protein